MNSQKSEEEILQSEEELNEMEKYIETFKEQGFLRAFMTKTEREILWRDPELEASLKTFSEYARQRRDHKVFDAKFVRISEFMW